MASGREILLSDLPPELMQQTRQELVFPVQSHWEDQLREWCDREFASGQTEILNKAIPAFEKVVINSALAFTKGRKREAAEILGWGRNTLTRKLKELKLDTVE